MGLTGILYRIVLVVHLTCAIGGFGSLLLDGLYYREALKRQGREALGISEANFVVSKKVSLHLIYLTGISGIGLVLLSRGHWSFSDTWVWASLVLFGIFVIQTRLGVSPVEARARGIIGEFAMSSPDGCATCPSKTSSRQGVSGSAGTCEGVNTGQATKTTDELDQMGSELERLTAHLAAMRGVGHLALLGFLYLMVFKP